MCVCVNVAKMFVVFFSLFFFTFFFCVASVNMSCVCFCCGVVYWYGVYYYWYCCRMCVVLYADVFGFITCVYDLCMCVLVGLALDLLEQLEVCLRFKG